MTPSLRLLLLSLCSVTILPIRAQLLVPVVVHVVHQGGPENISDAQVLSQLDVLNADFRRQNADTVNTRPIFRPVAADMGIEFCLATRDPQGQPTTGIDRVLSAETLPTALIAAHGWDAARYMNIYVMPAGNNFASFPWEPIEQQGIFITHGRFGTLGTAGTEKFAEFAHFGRTGTHEVGHYLGLLHTFSFIGDIDLCLGGDSVCDTPPTDMRWAVSSCLDHDLNTNEEIPDLPDQVENFMDYNTDSCSNMFTVGQRDRVLEKIAVFRSALGTEENLVLTGCHGVVGIGEPMRQSLALVPNPATDRIRINSEIPVRVDLFTSSGQHIRSTALEPRAWMAIHDLPAGTYIVRLASRDTMRVERLVVVR